MKMRKSLVFKDPQNKSAYSGYWDKAIGNLSVQHISSHLTVRRVIFLILNLGDYDYF